LTTNAPTVASAHFPKHYIPSQGLWGEKVGYEFITQRASGIVAARCDYADAYKFQHRPSDVPEATRDWVLIPSADGTEAALLVIDRANTVTAARGMHLRFRTPGLLALDGDKATATIGGSKLSIASVARSSPGTTALGRPTDRDCYKGNPPKGQCDAARFPVTEYRVQIEGPRPAAVHVISATAASSPPTKVSPISGKGWAGVRVSGVRDAFVVWRTTGEVGPLAYAAPSSQAMHVVLDALDGGELTATREGEGCKLALGGAASGTLKPLVAAVDPQCAVTLDPEAAAASAIGTKARRATRASSRSPRSGCCGAEATPGSSFAMALVVVVMLVRRRRVEDRS
jgi:MYXO-CTERM domain-containing protein